MSQELVSRSPDLKHLQDDGYEIEIKRGHLLVHHVPHVNSNKEVKFGILASVLTLANDRTVGNCVHTIYFKEDAARLDFRHPKLRRAFARTHAHFGRLLRHWHIREHADPHTAGALHMTRQGAACRFDLTRGHAFGFHRLQPVLAERKRRPRLRRAVNTALMLFTKFCALRLKHGSHPFLRPPADG